MGPNLIKFDQSTSDAVVEFGLNYKAVSEIMLGPPTAATQDLIDGPKWAIDYLNMVYKATDFSFRTLSAELVKLPNPVSGQETDQSFFFVPPERRTGIIVCKVFGGNQFAIVFAGISGNVTHLVVPSLNCVVYDTDATGADLAFDVVMRQLAEQTIAPGYRAGRVVIMDMVTNLAHQAMNYLAGLQRLIDCRAENFVDEIWIAGAEFFGPTEELFPELAAKIKRVPAEQMIKELQCTNLEPFKVRSNIITARLKDRIMALAKRRHPGLEPRYDRHPILAVTIRSQGRRCLNLPETVASVVHKLIETFPNLGVIIDGWVLPESAIISRSGVVTALLSRDTEKLRQEASLCFAVTERLPDGCLVGNTIGTSALKSLLILQSAHSYLSHIGTLQHKIAWFTTVRGVTHGPTRALASHDASAYASEVGYAVDVIDTASVEDLPMDNPRGESFFDYHITNVDGILRNLNGHLKNVEV